MKVCTTCQSPKDDCEFGVRRASADGLTATCKECLRARDRARYPKESKHRIERQKLYMQTTDGKRAHNDATARWRAANAEKRAAHVITGNAIRDGRLVPRPCEHDGCGVKKTEAHHDDYGQPLKVRWLCARHHKALHKQMAIDGIDP